MRYVHIFEYFCNPRDRSRKRTVVQTRDLGAALALIGKFSELGYRVGMQVLNYPPPVGEVPTLLEIDCSGMKAGDILITCTRPPLSDKEQGDRRRVPKGYTSLEEVTDAVWRRYFDILSRSHARLQPWLHPLLPSGYENRRDVFFLTNEHANYSMLNACDGSGRRKFREKRRTAAFLVNHPELWPGGPSYVGAFGMDGHATLAQAYLLRHRHPELLTQPGFHMMELHSVPVSERVPDLKWALEWKLELLFSVPPATSPAPEANPGPKKYRGGFPSHQPSA